MTRGELCAALGKVSGRFIEGYGSDPDLRDPVDVHALADLLHEELGRIVEREVADRFNARADLEAERVADELAEGLRGALDEWGGEP